MTYAVLVVSFIAAAFFSRFELVAGVGVAIGTVVSAHFCFDGGRLRWYGGLAIANTLFWLLYGFAIGSAPSVGGALPFISTEGRVLVSTIPLIGLSAVNLGPAHLRILERIFEATAAVLGVLIVAHVLKLPLIPRIRNGNFHGLTSSHHAAGFIGGITAIVLYMTRADRGRWRWLLIGAAIAAVLLSNSRASLVGLLAAGVFLAAWRIEMSQLVKSLVAILVVTAGVIALVPRVASTVGSLLDGDFQEQVSVVYSGGKRVSTSTAEANILRRVANFSNAQRFIESSPLIGIGAWRYDDDLGSRTGIEGLAAPFVSGDRVHSDAHAHNVYLQIAAETGLVGLTLFGALWIGLLVAIRRADRRRSRFDELSPWLLAAWCGIAFGLGVSITDIGLINPALAFPLLIVVGTVLGFQPGSDLRA